MIDIICLFIRLCMWLCILCSVVHYCHWYITVFLSHLSTLRFHTLLSCALLSLIYSSLFESLIHIETSIGLNKKKWRRDIWIGLWFCGLDMCLLDGKPTISEDDVSVGSKAIWKWEMSNMLTLTIIKKTIWEAIFGGATSCDNP